MENLKRTNLRQYLSPPLGLLFACLFTPAVVLAELSGSLEEDAITKRLTPDAQVNIDTSGASAPAGATLSADAGKKRYEYTCKMCHGTGVAGAPKLGDKALWQNRLAEGLDTLVQHAIHGYKAMPPKGGCATCSDEEIRKTVEFMISQVK